MEIRTRVRAVRAVLAHRRTERGAHRRLTGELATYRSPAERAELHELLGRHTAEETREIRAILNRQAYARRNGPTVPGGLST